MGKKRFSERIGFTKPPTLQIASMTKELRNSLWNTAWTLFRNERYLRRSRMSRPWWRLSQACAMNLFRTPLDEVPHEEHQCLIWIKEQFIRLEWYEVYDFIEQFCLLVEAAPGGTSEAKRGTQSVFNRMLEREMSGYRFVQGELVPISNDAEVQAVEDAIESVAQAGLTGAEKHLKQALHLLGKKPEPDHRNSIKESISAVESVCKVIAKDKSGGLDGALAKLSKATRLHGGLKAGFKSIYGYSSGEGGIRHAIFMPPMVGKRLRVSN